MYEQFVQWLTNLGFSAMGRFLPFLLILLAGVTVIRIITVLINRMLAKSKMEKAAHNLIRSLVRTVLYVLLGLMAVSSLGIDVSGILALASVATLAVSLALQDLLGNLVGGFTLLYTHPFSSGDYVEIAGQAGTIKEIGMTYTTLLTPDNKLTQIPNSSVVSSEIINYTVTGTRRVEILASASYDMPVDDVIAAMKEAANVEGILPEQGINAMISEYGEYAIQYTVRVWCPTDKYWDVYHAANYNVKKVFDARGIRMTYPHLNVHLDK